MCILTVQSNTRLQTAGKYMIIKFSSDIINIPVESKIQSLLLLKYSINVNCGKQQIYRFGPDLNFNVK